MLTVTKKVHNKSIVISYFATNFFFVQFAAKSKTTKKKRLRKHIFFCVLLDPLTPYGTYSFFLCHYHSTESHLYRDRFLRYTIRIHTKQLLHFQVTIIHQIVIIICWAYKNKLCIFIYLFGRRNDEGVKNGFI